MSRARSAQVPSAAAVSTPPEGDDARSASTRPLRLVACALSAAALAGALAAAGWVASERGSVTRLASCRTLGFDCAHGRVRIAEPAPATASPPPVRPSTGGAQAPAPDATAGSTRVVAAAPAAPDAPSAPTVVGDVTTVRPPGAQGVPPVAAPVPPTVQPVPAPTAGRPTTVPLVTVAVATVTGGVGPVTGVVASAVPRVRSLPGLTSLLSAATRVDDRGLPVAPGAPALGGLPSVTVAVAPPVPAAVPRAQPGGDDHTSGPPSVPPAARRGPGSPSGHPQGPSDKRPGPQGPPGGVAGGPHPDRGSRRGR